MKSPLILSGALLGLSLLAGCSQQSTDAAKAGGGVETQRQPTVVEIAKGGDAVLFAGYKPSFTHKVSSQRTEPQDGGLSKRVVVVSAPAQTQEQVVRALSADARDNGFGFSEIESVDGSNRRFLMSNPAGTRMTVIVNKQDERQKTVVLFNWKE